MTVSTSGTATAVFGTTRTSRGTGLPTGRKRTGGEETGRELGRGLDEDAKNHVATAVIALVSSGVASAQRITTERHTLTSKGKLVILAKSKCWKDFIPLKKYGYVYIDAFVRNVG